VNENNDPQGKECDRASRKLGKSKYTHKKKERENIGDGYDRWILPVRKKLGFYLCMEMNRLWYLLLYAV